MPLAQYDDLFWFPSGELAANIPARIFPLSSNKLAALYADSTATTPLPNPLRTGADGRLTFWAEQGLYWIHIDSETFRVGVGISDTGGGVTQEELAAALAALAADTTDVHGIPDTAALETKSGAQAKANEVRDELGEAIVVSSQQAAADLAAHEADTTQVHGIADTAALETKSGAQAKADEAQTTAVDMAHGFVTEHAAQTMSVHGIADTSKLLTQASIDGLATEQEVQAVAADLATHEAATTQVHGIADTSALLTSADLDGYATDAELAAHVNATKNVHGIPDTSQIPSSAQIDAVAGDLAAHEAATANVHGIADTGALLTSADLDGYATDAELAAHTTATTQVHGIADTAALETKSGAQTKANAAQAAAEATAASTYIAKTARGAASGVAALDASSLIPADQVPWEHVWQPSDLGLKAWICDPANAQSTGQYPGSGPMRMAAVVLRRTTTVSRIVWHFTGYAGGLQTGSWAGIYRATTGAKVGTIANLSSAASEPAEQHGPGGGTSSSPLDEGTVSLTAGVYYVAWRMVYNTTTQDGPMMLALENAAGSPPNVFGMNNVRRFGYTASPGATVPTTIPAMENGANRFWVGLA